MRRSTPLLVVLLLSACVRPSVKDDITPPVLPGNGDPNVLLADEIATVPAISAYEAIQKLRANFLSSRGSVTIKNGNSPLPAVWLDGAYYGDLTALRNIQAANVEKIQMFRAWEATTKFGSQYTAGVIAVQSKRS